MGALSRTLAGDLEPDVPLALARALTAAPQFRPSPRELARTLGDADQTAVLGVDEVDPTRVAPTWFEDAIPGDEDAPDDDVSDDYPLDDDEEADEEEFAEAVDRVLPRRRLVLAAWGLALIAFATIAPVAATALAVVAAIVARGADSATRAVWRSRDRRGVEAGGVVAQVFASPWHLLRALVLTLPSALLAAGSAYLVGWLGFLLARNANNPLLWEAVALALAATLGLVLLGWGPRGREARRGAHLIAAGVAPGRIAMVCWAAAGAIVAVVCAGIGFAGVEPLWWPVG